MKILYYDCFAGISGDMNLGAMIDLGIEADFLRKELLRLPVHGYTLKVEKDIRKGITGTRVQVIIDDLHLHLADHDHEHHHEHEHEHHHEHEHEHGHSHGHLHPYQHENTPLQVHGLHHHRHNSFAEIKEMILSSSLDDKVKDLGIAIFESVANAEGKVHDKPAAEVHFHEVGALDSIVDIVGAAICLNKLGVDSVWCSTVELGGGSVRCAHGIYPVPAPATAEIVKNMPVRKGTVDYEATTPTGAAILSACVNEFTDRAAFSIVKTGYGIGSKDSTIPNVLRVFLCESSAKNEPETVPSQIIECNIDDMNPEFYDYIIDSLLAAGAKDVYITPIIMKKSRPAVKLSVLCTRDTEDRVNEILFRETSTIGVRKYGVEKTMLGRKIETVATRYGDVRVKSAYFRGECVKSKPEYDDCIKIARDQGIPVNQVYREVEQVLGRKEGKL
jgi:pyridinium-3,5-bisthiocarboxylic acid mononucleotide nickel chelatase